MSNQEKRQQSVRASTGTAYSYNDDWMALFTAAGITSGTYNERLLVWINARLSTAYATLPDAMRAYAISQGVPSWNEMGTFILGAAFTPSSLFAASEPGFLLDATLADLSSLFQDDAGTIPVTAVEQSVGLALDDSQNAVGTNGAKRVNLLTWTEAFDNAYWVKGRTTATADQTTAPNGTTTADLVSETAVTNSHIISSEVLSFGSGVSYTQSVYVKNAPSGRGFFQIVFFNFAAASANAYANFDIVNGTVTASSNGTASISSVGDGWFHCVFVVAPIGARSERANLALITNGSATSFESYAGDITKGLYLWGADLRLASEASTLPTYQPITSSWPSTMAGNHFVQSTSAARPVLSARVNLALRTELLGANSVVLENWSSNNITGTNNNAVAPDGTTTAARLLETTTNAGHSIFQSGGYNVSAALYEGSFSLKGGLGRQWAWVNVYNADNPTAAAAVVFFDLTNGVVGTVGAGATGQITAEPNGFYRCTVTRTLAAGVYNTANAGYIVCGPASADGVASYAGNVANGIYAWGADLRVANDTASPVYQRVNTATDYNAVGFPLYLNYDGVDDFLVSAATVNFSTTAQMSVFAGVRRGAITSNYQTLYEHSASVDANNGTFGISGENIVAGGRLYASSKGTTVALAVPTAGTLNSISTNLLTHLMNISAPSVSLSSNSILVASSSSSQGTGNFGNYLFYIGRRAGTTTPLNGRIYFPLVVLGRTATATEITNMESFINTRNGIY